MREENPAQWNLFVGGDIAHERQIGGALVDALTGCGLRRDRTGERGNGRKREDKEKRYELRRTLGHDKYLHVVWCGVDHRLTFQLITGRFMAPRHCNRYPSADGARRVPSCGSGA